MPYTVTFTVPLIQAHSVERALAVASEVAKVVKSVDGAESVKDVSIKSVKGPR